MKVALKIFLLSFVLTGLLLSCSKNTMQYAEDVQLNSKYGFWIMGGFTNDTVSLSINGIQLLDKVVFPAPVAYLDQDPHKDYGSSFLIELDNGQLSVQIFNVNYPPLDFKERKEINIVVVKGNVESEFVVNLRKGRFINIIASPSINNKETPTHYIITPWKDFWNRFRALKIEEVDISIAPIPRVRLYQFKKAPAVM